MKTKSALLILLTFLSSVFAEYVTVSENTNKEIVELSKERDGVTTIDFNLKGYKKEVLTENGTEYIKVSIENEGEYSEEGMPDLPVISRMFAVEKGITPSITVTDVVTETIKDVNVYPTQELKADLDKSPRKFIMNSQFYNGNKQFPENIATSSEPAIMRGMELSTISINPFIYNPEKRELTVIKSAKIEVQTGNPRSIVQKRSRYFEPLFKAVVANYDLLNRDELEYQRPCVLFIYPDENQVLTNLEYLAEWKREKGFEVHTASTSQTGSSVSNIKNYILDAYNNWENPPEFIVIVGDASGSYTIQTSYFNGGEGDHEYTMLEGNDLLADVFIGRLSFNTISEFQTIIAKTLNYEKTPHIGSGDWLKNVLLVGDPSSSGPSTITTSKYIKETIEEEYPSFTFDENYSGNFSQSITNGLNSGAAYFNYRGFLGMSGFTNSSITSLSNGPQLTVAIISTCDTGTFASGTSRSEEFVKAGSVTQFKGAIASVGTATSHTHTTFNNSVVGGIFHGIFADDLFNMGAALVRGKLSLYQNFPTNPNSKVTEFSYWNNLMGDPTAELWTGEVNDLIVDFPTSVSLGTQNVEITVNRTASNSLEEAWVTLYKNGELSSTGFTDSDGKVVLPIEEGVTGEVKLTVTKHGYKPYQTSISISNPNISVAQNGLTIDDSQSGNNNSLANPGEDFELKVDLKNFGSQQATNITATVTSESEFITVTNSTVNYGNISAGSSVTPTSGFGISVSDDAVEADKAQLNLEVTDGTNTWTDKVTFNIYGVLLTVEDYTVEDSNGQLDPGETVQVVIEALNDGSILAENVSAEISINHSEIYVDDSTGSFGNIASGATALSTTDNFTLRATNNVIPGTQVPVEINFTTSNGYDKTESFLITVGSVTVTDPVGPDAYGYVMYDDEDTDYPDCPTYDWIEIDPQNGGAGTHITSLYDSGDEGDSEMIPLPFTMKFYSKEYDRVTICTNGWISPGDSELDTFMNWHIPGPLGPSPIIAPFWDDLRTGRVCYLSDPANGRFIVQWDMALDYNGADEVFQAIIYDPSMHTTSTGDSKILFQYKEVNNDDLGSYSGFHVNHGEFCTVGIEHHNGNIGLEYTFSNIYAQAAKTLHNEMAILVAPAPITVEEPQLIIDEVLVYDNSGNNALEAGEEADLIIKLENIGINTANNTSLELSTSSEYIEILDDSAVYNNIAGGTQASNFDNLKIKALPDAPNGHIATIDVDITSTEDSWEYSFDVEVKAPIIDFKWLIINDGDDNILAPGETTDIIVSLENSGGADLNNVSATLSSSNNNITINQSSDSKEGLEANSGEAFIFNISASSSVSLDDLIEFELDVVADNNFNQTFLFTTTIGKLIETFEGGVFSAVKWENLIDTNWETTQDDAYEGTWSAKSGLIPNSTTSSISAEVTVVDGSKNNLSFYCKVDAGSGDELHFYIDGIEQDILSPNAWTQQTYNLEPGTHVLIWSYQKNGSGTSGNDCAYIDNIQFPALQSVVYTEIAVSQNSYSIGMMPGQTETYSINISNLGNAPLNYELGRVYQTSAGDDTGGPDEFGYTFKDSNEPNGPDYEWIEISEIGTALSFTHNTVGTDLMPIGFDFEFYGITYDEFRVNPNGWIGFGEDNNEWSNTEIPSAGAPKPACLGFWDDLVPEITGGGGTVYYHTTSERLVIQWDEVEHWESSPGTYTFEIIIYPNGRIKYQYQQVQGEVNSNTIGIQNETGTVGLQAAYNENYATGNMAIEFYPPADWFTFDNTQGSVAVGTSEDAEFNISTELLPQGSYLCNLLVMSNDPNNGTIEIPVNLTVSTTMAAIQADTDSLEFESISIDTTSTMSVFVTNVGQATLHITEVTSDNVNFTVNNNPVSIAPSQTSEVEITFAPVSAGEKSGNITIKSNDPNRPELDIAVTGVATDSVGIGDILPRITKLIGNYPNPFNPSTVIEFSLEKEMFVNLSIYNIKGEKISTIINSKMSAGNHKINWNGLDGSRRGLSAGIYFYSMKTPHYNKVKRMLLIK